MADPSASSFTYLTRFRLSDGTVTDSLLTTQGRRTLGDIVNLPTQADGTSRTGTGYIWRVSSVEAHDDPLIEAVLVLDFEGSHANQE